MKNIMKNKSVWIDLYHSVNKLLEVLGADGEIIATQDEVSDVFNVLERIDGGKYDPDFKE